MKPRALGNAKSAMNYKEHAPRPSFIKNAQLRESFEGLHSHPQISAVLEALYKKDPYTFEHCHRVADTSGRIAVQMGLSPLECIEVYLSGLLHDIGKIRTQDEVLKKPGPLSPDEFIEIKRHPVDSGLMVRELSDIAYLEEALRGHHERIDGKGYPDQLGGDQIPLYSRIILVADTFDAMTSNRVYRKKLSLERTYEELLRFSGSQFDPAAVQAFIAMHQHLLVESKSVEDQKKAA